MPTKKQSPKALQFQRQFTRDGVSPYDMFDYDYRTSVIKNPTGEVVFQMDNVEVPKQWSQIATDILAQKYFRKAGVPQPDGSTRAPASSALRVNSLVRTSVTGRADSRMFAATGCTSSICRR